MQYSGMNLISLKSQQTGMDIALYNTSKISHKLPLKELMHFNDPNMNIIICPDAKSLEIISYEYSKNNPLYLQNEKWKPSESKDILNLFQETGYRIVKPSLEDHYQYVFLNLAALEHDEVMPSINFVSRLNYHFKEGAQVRIKQILETILKGETRLYHDIGFQSCGPYYAINEIIVPLSIEICGSWVEYLTMRDISEKLSSAELGRFVRRRLNLFNKVFEHLIENYKNDEVSLPDHIVKISRILAFCNGIISNQEIHDSCILRIGTQCEKAADIYRQKNMTSLGLAINDYFSNMKESSNFTDIQTFEFGIINALSKAYSVLEPEFYMRGGMIYFSARSEEIGYQLSRFNFIELEPSIRIFLDECERIADNPKTPEHLALYARMTMEQVLYFFGYAANDPHICHEIKSVISGTINRFFDSMDRIREKCEEYPITETDLLLQPLGAMGMCVAFNEFEIAQQLKDIIISKKDHPASKTPLANLYWLEFMTREDYDSLERFKAILPEIRVLHEPKNVMLEETFQMESLIADAISIKEHRTENFRKAQLSLEEVEISPIMDKKETMQRNALRKYIRVMPFLYDAASAPSFPLLISNLINAVDLSQELSINERPESPNQLFYHKCLVLKTMACGDVEYSIQLIQKIKGNPFYSKYSEELCLIIEKWIESKKQGHDLVLTSLELRSDSSSPWIQIAHRILTFFAGEEYGKTLSNYIKGSALLRSDKGMGSHYRGIALEAAVCLCYCKDGYDSTQRFIFNGEEIMDLICYDINGPKCSALLIDVKGKSETYEPKDARDLACRVKKIAENIEVIIPIAGKKKYEIKVIVVSESRISTNARNNLKDNLDEIEIPFEIIAKDQLKKFLLDHNINPSLYLLKEKNGTF